MAENEKRYRWEYPAYYQVINKSGDIWYLDFGEDATEDNCLFTESEIDNSPFKKEEFLKIDTGV